MGEPFLGNTRKGDKMNFGEMNFKMEILDRVFFGNTVLAYAISLAILFVGLIFVKVLAKVVVKRVKDRIKKDTADLESLIAQVLGGVVMPVLYLSCVYASLKILNLPAKLDTLIGALEVAVITFFAARLALMIIGYGLRVYAARKPEDVTLVRSLETMFRASKYLVWAMAVIIFLDNIGFKISAVIAGLGIGGVAVAIAAQAVFKDFFSYFSIVFDRPFKLGDFIIIGDFMGTVEYIGIKTTRIRSLSGEQLIFSNTDLTESRVRNYQMMRKRRVLFRLGVTYDTSFENLKEIPGIIEKVIKGIDDTTFDRAHFFSYGDFSLVFEIVYYVMAPEYNKYMDIQQKINLAIKEEFDKRGIEFAFPSQTLYLKKE